MEDFPLLVLFFIIYLIAGSSSRKKNKNRQARRGPMRTRSQGEQLDMRAFLRDMQTKEGFQTAFSEGQDSDEPSCAQKRMHLHEVTDEQMLHAAEGEDPCHAGGAPSPALETEIHPEEEQQELAQDVLRGVIMGEILMRPHERAAMRRRRTNGY